LLVTAVTHVAQEAAKIIDDCLLMNETVMDFPQQSFSF